MMTKDSAQDLRHIEAWLATARDIVTRGKDAYLSDPILQEAGDSVMMKIGEAANRLARADVRPDGVEWPNAIANRNQILHDYELIDRDITWDTLSTDLPDLESRLTSIIEAARRVVLLPGGGKATGPSDRGPGFKLTR